MTLARCAVMPLPGMVAFPGHTVPLHIFEPRYRRMVKDCIAQDLPLGIARAVRTIATHRAPAGATAEDELARNLDTFEPASIFGVGRVRLLRVLDDGRLLIEVDVDRRVELRDVTQEVPYLVAEIADKPYAAASARERVSLARRIMAASRTLLGVEARKFEAVVAGGARNGRDLESLCFLVMTWLRVPDDLGQTLLEAPDEQALAATVCGWLELVVERTGGAAGAPPPVE